ncbi:MAG: PEP-utilizing enzyme, mobile region [Desulfobacteraceae bacterium]|nr:PEP-utilizing enzyme, mobile region [Desulfobacteraceae bacterium]
MVAEKFPSPHEIETIPGTEGWERMYPYHYQFTTDDKERTEYEKNMFWFNDALHYPEPMYPFDIIWDEAWFLALSQFNTRIFMVPPALGVDHRIINGNVYITPVPVADSEEVVKRIPMFMERAGYYYEHWNELHDGWEKKMEKIISELKALEIKPLAEMEDFSVVKKGLGTSGGYMLLKNYDKLIDLGIECWQYHFEFLNLGYAAYVTFVDFCTKAFPDIPLQRVTQMVGGIDVIMYRPDEELKKLAKLAVELKVNSIIGKDDKIDEVVSALSKSENGKKWLAAWDKAKEPWFNVSTGTGWYHHDLSWNDDLNVPLNSLRIYIEKLEAGDTIDRPLKRIQEERERITREYRSMLKTDEDRQTFDQLQGTSKLVFPYVENHLFYVEHWFHSVFWNKMREVSAIMKAHNFLNDIEDIWFLSRSEIKEALWDLVTAWATGTKGRGTLHWPKEIEWRKGVYRKFKEWTPPPAVGTPPETITEPFTIVLWGITNDSMAAWAKLREVGDPDKVTELNGFAGSPGKVEGIARVCRSVKEIDELKDGEILVAPTTSPSWAPVFQKIQACVTDVGGIMCHAAIVCREYGMPAVVGTGQATTVIKTGMKIKVDGNTGQIDIER